MSDHGFVTLIGPKAAALIGPTASEQLVRSLRDAARQSAPLTPIIAALSRVAADELPSFGCVVREGASARLMVRGAASAIVIDTSAKRHRLYQPTTNTWGEKLVERASEVVLGWEDPLATPIHVVFMLDSGEGRSNEPIETSTPRKKASTPRLVAPTPQPTPQPVPEPSLPTPVPIPEPASLSAPVETDTLTSWVEPVSTGVAAAEPRSDEFDFSHLVDNTRYHGVEAAAVREPDASMVDDEYDAVSFDAPVAPAPAPIPSPSPAPSTPTPTPTPVSEAGWTPPSLLSTDTHGAPPPAAPANVARVDTGSDLDDNTRHVQRRAPASTDDVEAAEDFDDATRAINRKPANGGARTLQEGTGPEVQAVACALGHVSSPAAAVCRVCKSPIEDRSIVLARRPSLGRLRFDDGLLVELNAGLIIGRNPSVPAGRDEVRSVTLPDPERSLSRSHAEIVLEDWQVGVRDLGSTNGTVVEAPGEEPVRLRGADLHVVGIGTRVVLGGAVVFEIVEADL